MSAQKREPDCGKMKGSQKADPAHPARSHRLILASTCLQLDGGAIQSPGSAISPQELENFDWQHHFSQLLALDSTGLLGMHLLEGLEGMFPSFRRCGRACCCGTGLREDRHSKMCEGLVHQQLCSSHVRKQAGFLPGSPAGSCRAH